jgi:hypothetical protein
MKNDKTEAKRARIEKAFSRVTVWALFDGTTYAGAVKWARQGNGMGTACQVCFRSGPLHVLPATFGRATGYGYDKASASLYNALSTAAVRDSVGDYERAIYNVGTTSGEHDEANRVRLTKFRLDVAAAMEKVGKVLPGFVGGDGRSRQFLEALGYTVVEVA